VSYEPIYSLVSSTATGRPDCNVGQFMTSDLRSVGFHESSIARIRRDGTTITLELEGVHFEMGTLSASVRLMGVQTITRDGIEVGDLVPESEDGEVLTLQSTENTLHLIVEWPDFENHQNQTRSYRITYDALEIEIY
jgi:hypothetical protein